MTAAEDEFWDLFGEWGKDSEGNPKPCSVETFQGTGQKGPKYAAAVSHPGLPQMPQRRLVRTTGGNEVLSTSALAMPVRLAADFPLHSRVTLADGRTATVLSVAAGDTQGLFGFMVVNLE